MKYIKNFLTGVCVATISMAGVFLKNTSTNTCTGMCKFCGGSCVNTLLFMPFIGAILLIIRKIKKPDAVSED